MTQKSEKPPTAMRLFLFAWLVAMPLLDACGTTPVGSNQDAGTERADSGAAQPDVKGTGGVGSGGSTGIGGAGGSTSDARGSDGAGGVPDSGRGGSGGSEIGGGGTDGGSGGGMNDGGTCPAAAPMPTFGEGGPVYQRCASANQVCSYSRSFCECKPPPAGGEANGGLVWICQPIL